MKPAARFFIIIVTLISLGAGCAGTDENVYPGDEPYVGPSSPPPR